METNEPSHIISLGAGVQSSTMALMAAKGEITPMPKCAIFADTQDEPRAVYKWLDWLEKQLPFPVHRVTIGKLSELATRIHVSKKTGLNYTKPSIPLFTLYPDSRPNGRMFRHCSMDAKITPITKRVKAEIGKQGTCILWIGISVDEIQRMKDSREPRIKHTWPLIDAGITRNVCLEWIKKNGLPIPPRSACVYCPFHSDSEWIKIRSESEEEFQFAVEFEKRIQEAIGKCSRIDSKPFLHASRVPLDQVKFDNSSSSNFQMQLPCEGMCGV